MTPFYDRAGVTLFCGDCRTVLPTLEAGELLLTDIPYGEVNRSDSGLRNLDKGDADTETVPLDEIARLLVPQSGSSYVWCGTEQVSALRAATVAAGCSTRLGIWEKTNPSPMNGEYLWLSSVEVCVYGKRPRAYFGEFCASPVWRGPTCGDTDHPTEKPLWLFKRLIQTSSRAGDLVIDPFVGSGTTLRAAKDLGRRAIGIEISEEYCRIAVDRLRQDVLFSIP